MTSQRGFTLIEMAIVLVIITILIGGLAMPLSAQIQARRIAETKKTLDEARDALMGYAMMTGVGARAFLPCPDTNGDGIQDRAGTGECLDSNNLPVGSVAYGRFPWVTLGTASQDAWGNRLRYVVVSQFANSTIGFSRSNPVSSVFLQICTTHACPNLVADSVVFALISHGPNGWGAMNVNSPPGATQASPSGPDEAQNLAQNSTLVMRTPTQADSALGEFDDLVVWMPRTELTSRVCPSDATGASCGHY